MSDCEYFALICRRVNIYFSIVQVCTNAHTRIAVPESRATKIHCRNKANPQQFPSALSLSPLFALSSTFLYNTVLFPLPSCSIATSVTALTFPALHLPLSSSLLSSPLPLPSLPIYSQSHRARPPKSKIMYDGWQKKWGGEDRRDITRLSLSLSGTIPLGDLPSTESHLRTCQPDKHK